MYKIGEFSKKVNISIDTLRYYEKECLIVPSRVENNLRVYTNKDIIWIEFIKKLKLTGMSIKNIKKYAKLRYEGDETIPQRMDLLFDQRHNWRASKRPYSNTLILLIRKLILIIKCKKKLTIKKSFLNGFFLLTWS